MTTTIRISVLGPLRIWRDSVPVPAGSPQSQALLATLLLRAGQVASMDEVIAAVWGDDLPATAVATARTYIYRLRRLFEGTDVSIRKLGGGYVLDAERAQIDVADFEERVSAAQVRMQSGDHRGAAVLLQTALTLWQGEALAGVPGRYAARQRARLEESRTTAEELFFTARLRSGDVSADELRRLTELVAAYPLHEGLRVSLMLALYRRGRQADALELYRAGRDLLRQDLALEPGPGLRDMHRRILQADRGLHPAPTGTKPVHLPADLPDFVGRDDELAVLSTAVSTPGAVVGITGGPGSGRSTTAVHAAHLLAERFADGCLHANLADADGLHDALFTWLRVYGAADTVPSTTAGRAALLRTVAGSRNPLIILDDVEDAGHVTLVRSALPRAAVVLVARRTFPTLPGIRWVTLGGLTDEAAMRLFERIAGRHRVTAEREPARLMIAAVAGSPLSVRLGAERAARRPHRTLRSLAEELVTELHDPTAPLHDDCLLAEAPHEHAYALLRPEPARALRFLAASDACTATVPEAAALMDATENTALTALDTLVDLHLIEDGADGRYRITDPITQSLARRKLHEIEGPAGIGAAWGRVYGLLLPSRP